MVKVAAAVQAQKNALTSPGKVKEPYQTTKSEDNIPVLLSQTVSRKVDGRSLQLTANKKSALASRDVVFYQRLNFSKDEQNQFEKYDPTSDNPILPSVSILQSTCPIRNEKRDILSVCKKKQF